MKRLFFLSLAFILAFMLISCDSGNTGDFKITLKLPIDYESVCNDLDDPNSDYTYCINESDQVMLSIYSKSNIADDYVYADRKLIKVTDNKGGKEEFIRSLKKGAYYRFFVEVTNSNEKLKLTGGIDGVYYDDKNNYDVDIFLAPVGDFARVVADRGDAGKTSLMSYFGEGGSKGAAAVALKDGSIYMAGGFDLEEEEVSNKAVIFDMQSISKNDVKDLPVKLYDHIAALLDDGTETGKIVVGLGMTEDDQLNASVWIYDPKNNKYDLFALGAPEMTKAKAITIDGDVYIVGGCSNKGEAGVYRISAKTGSVVSETFATLKQGRCNHAVADVSIVNVDENGVKTVTPRILVIGGSTDTKEGKETPVLGENFAELVTQGVSTPMAVADRNGGDDAELKTKGLISPAAVGVLMDDKEETETVVAVLGGYLRNGEGDAETWVSNPSLLVFSEKGENALVYDKNGTANECARPSAALLGSEEKNVIKYVAVNCGTQEIDRIKRNATDQVVFVLQVKRVKDSDLGIEVFSSSVKDSLMEGNNDPESDAIILDGPVAVDALGQVFMLGGQFVYQVGSYAVP
ncbi:hypothetical protein II898_04495 [bacterium]|nr:hypothetical protein [bacterium]